MEKSAELPEGLPIPVDDGACDHLPDQPLPNISLPATSGIAVNLSQQKDWLVIYCYPMTGRPDVQLPDNWDSIPGARGCTPQSCAFRDHYQELRQYGASVFGLSTQMTDYQLEAKQRLHLPFELLSDHNLEFATALNLPLFEVNNMQLIKRLTLIASNGIIKKVFYPVFPPDENAEQVIEWLMRHRD